MKLSFRGNNFDYVPAHAQLSDEELQAQYRGQTLLVHHTSKNAMPHPNQPLIYRGVTY
ncbi:DUF4278 domain-containing protein [Thermostichus vulcanus]|uniref:DUF4278 domain-containing protein n=1 Tax=Thermostichus vulcanus str. 'Rupite' TaxID=2813851 RepID=A0ABT0C896_THEVL|nr:DUF4278 domain-containing protein [Thermostichus vulcanus]MCJ2541969.1 DUF4278 domain-containing protein [Thermostichus vulcanus str. 'Rupite']